MNTDKSETLDNEIINFLSNEELDYWTGVKLYEKHPASKRNVIENLNDNGKYQKDFMHQKLISELERITNQNFTFRQANLNATKASIEEPKNLIKDTDKKAPRDYIYNIPYEELPENLQKAVIQKGQYYDELDKRKKQLTELGPNNDESTKKKRRQLLTEMRNFSNTIIVLHQKIQAYDPENSTEEKTQTSENNLPQQEHTEPPENEKHLFSFLEKEEAKQRIDDFIKFKKQIPEMNSYEIQNHLQNLRIQASKQKNASQNAKKESTRTKNANELQITETKIKYLENANQSQSADGENTGQQNPDN